MMESFNADVSDNVFENNKYGTRFSVGCGRNIFSKNVITGSAKYVYASRNKSRLSSVRPAACQKGIGAVLVLPCEELICDA